MEFEVKAYESDTRFSDFYTKIGILGEGSFGTVLHCVNKRTAQECAVKLIPIGKSSLDFERVETEVEILASLHHPNIVQFHSVLQVKDIVCLQMELLHGDSLKSHLRTRHLQDREAAAMMRGVFQAVAYIHSKNIYHQDLKPENILFVRPNVFEEVKITDFGLSAKFEGSDFVQNVTDLPGTAIYMAPEQGTRFYYSKAVDIWSCGIVLYMSLTGRHPLFESNDSVKSYMNKLKSPIWTFPPNFSPMAKNLFLHLTAMEPLQRYTAEQALRHPWVSGHEGEIPRTCLEQLREIADLDVLKRVFYAVFFASTVLAKSGIKAPASRRKVPILPAIPKIRRDNRIKTECPKPLGALTTREKSHTLSHLYLKPRLSPNVSQGILSPVRLKKHSGKSIQLPRLRKSPNT